MKTSETIGKISEALAKAQGEMKPASFDSTNPHFRSKYASLTAIMEACRSSLSTNNIAIVQGTSVEENRVIVTTMLVHSSGEFISDQLSLNTVKDTPQGVGSAITYARRYSLSSMVGIVSDEDDDAEGATDNNVKPSRPVLVKNIQMNKKSKTETKTINKPVAANNPVQERVSKIRQIFTLSAKLGHSPDDMKSVIGNLIGFDKPIKESSDIQDKDLDGIIQTFTKDLELKKVA